MLMARTIQVVQDHTEDIGTISTTGARALVVQEANEAMSARRYGTTYVICSRLYTSLLEFRGNLRQGGLRVPKQALTKGAPALSWVARADWMGYFAPQTQEG